MEKYAIILDLDNTLYSWMDSYAPALQAAIKYLARALHLPVPVIRASFKETFQEHGSVEVVNSVKELRIWETVLMTNEEIEMIQDEAQSLFFEAFQNNLQLFPNVEFVLSWAKSNGIKLIAFSDARAFWIDFRLRALNLYPFFDQVYVLSDEVHGNVCSSCYPESIVQYEPQQSKPSKDVFVEILRSNDLQCCQALMIGDSKKKDIKPALQLGIATVWARYGSVYSSSSRRLLGSITPWTSSQRAGGGRIYPQYSIDDFSEVVEIVKKQMEA